MDSYKDKYPVGTYLVRALGMVLTESKDEKAYFKVKVEVLQPRKVDDPSDFVAGGHRYLNLYLSPKKLEETQALFHAAGFDAASVSSIEDFDIAGFSFLANCKHNEYNGNSYDNFELAKYWDATSSGVSTGWMEKITPASSQKRADVNNLFGIGKKGWTPQQTQQQAPRKSAF